VDKSCPYSRISLGTHQAYFTATSTEVPAFSYSVIKVLAGRRRVPFKYYYTG